MKSINISFQKNCFQFFTPKCRFSSVNQEKFVEGVGNGFGGDINVVDNAPPSISATEWWEEAGAAQISSSLQYTMKAFVSHDNNIKNCYHFPLPKKHIPMLALLILKICYRVLALYNCWFFVLKFNFSLLIEDFLTSSRTSFGFFLEKEKN